jgi:hypothetical protein
VALSLGVKQLWCEADHLHLANKFRKTGAIPPLILMAWLIISAQGQLYLYKCNVSSPYDLAAYFEQVMLKWGLKRKQMRKMHGICIQFEIYINCAFNSNK